MEKNDSQGLVLYEYFACPFCFRTRHAIKQLGVQIERRDIIQNPHHREELLNGGGKTQVPCLQIVEDQQVTWLYESADIIRFLKTRFTKQM